MAVRSALSKREREREQRVTNFLCVPGLEMKFMVLNLVQQAEQSTNIKPKNTYKNSETTTIASAFSGEIWMHVA